VAKLAVVAQEEINAGGGDVVEIQGDEVVAVFTSARHAMQAALQLQSRFEKETEADHDLPMHVGIGLDAGEVIPAGDGFSGRALILASRLCSIAHAGEVLASEGVVHLAGRTEGLEYVDLGPVHLKGMSESVRATRIVAQS
jgi:adenylate cyclase